MLKLKAALCLTVLFFLTVSTPPAGADTNMLGRQSHNTGIEVVPAPGQVNIDGKIDDWDLSGRIWSFADIDVRERYSAQTSMMWDNDYLYIAVQWQDPTPLYNLINPEFDRESGWKSDCLQMRVETDQIMWLTAWHYTPKQRPVLHKAIWRDPNNHRGGVDVEVLVADAGSSELSKGVKMAFSMNADGRGYVQEIALPWKVLYREVPEIGPGLAPKIGLEFLWGDVTGQNWPIHRYADNLQPDHTSREFFWSARRAWGNALLVAEGNVPTRTYIVEDEQLVGTIPIRIEVPLDAIRFTLAINDMQGVRIRNLASELRVADYEIDRTAESVVLQVPWDGLDDASELVAPGDYRVIGLTHQGIGAEYDMTFYNPGTPPWHTADERGAWGANHTAPIAVTPAGNRMIVTWPGTEGGHAVICLGPNDRKLWGELRGASFVAADNRHIYAYSLGHRKAPHLFRLATRDGAYRPFTLDGQKRPFDLPVSTVFGEQDPGAITGMALHGDTLALARSNGKIALLDAESAVVRRQFDLNSEVGSIAFSPDGKLYAVLDNTVASVDIETGMATFFGTPGLSHAGAITVDHDGNVVVFDAGPDNQLKAYSPVGELVYTAGRRGGRPIRGEWEPQAMMRVSSVAVDHQGRIWVTEYWNYPRRVSVWGRDGQLATEFVGNTGYASTCTFMHDSDPDLAYVGPIEIRLDRETRTWEVTRILWVPDKDEHFEVNTRSHAHPQRFRSDASGRMREYMFVPPYRDQEGYVLFMELDNGSWQPVSAIGVVGALTGDIRSPNLPYYADTAALKAACEDIDPYDGFFWNDLNGDGRVQRDELVIVPTEHPSNVRRPQFGLPLGSGWGQRMSPGTMSLYISSPQGILRHSPIEFNDNGAPVYGPEGMHYLGIGGFPARQDMVPVDEDNLLLNISTRGSGGPHDLRGIDLETNSVLWTYPNMYPSVHGSHRAPLQSPGLLVGPLKICGVAHIDDEVGRVFSMRGNLGVEYFMTTDGLYVAGMFRDGRLPAEALPPREAEFIGAPADVYSQGGEPFSGWFGRHDDGKVRLATSMARTAGMTLNILGLNSIRRYTGPSISLDAAILADADHTNRIRAVQTEAEQTSCTVVRLPAAITIDGNPADWQEVAPLPIASPASSYTGKVRMAYDDRNLYLLYEINDPHPWRNIGRDYQRLFKTGDAVDLHLATNPDADPDRRQPGPGDIRLVIAQLEDNPAAVLMRPVAPDAPADQAVTYSSPVGDRTFDSVRVVRSAQAAVNVGPDRYTVEAAIPLAELGLTIRPGLRLTGDIGFVSSNAEGTYNNARTYWANKLTTLTNDEPQEAWLYPDRWNEIIFE